MIKELKKVDLSMWGLLTETFVLRHQCCKDVQDIREYKIEYCNKEYKWFKSSCFPSLSCTSPKSISPRLGIRVITPDIYMRMLDVSQVIKIFHEGDYGDYFVNEIKLYWPLYYLCKEPIYVFETMNHDIVNINALSGKVNLISLTKDKVEGVM
ncbi:MAG: hypothetical protein ACEPOV_02130 [Hyphomicrobiales bacterium]